MSGRMFVPRETVEAQARAADPGQSVWVSANAGSGKTHVLSRRVIRLLLGGADPARILCLTYTKAAAANMINRVFRDLGNWATMDDEQLAGEIANLEDKPPDVNRLALARQLFARALETPGGLKIQTIHAFCESILHQFPLEANIAGHFELLDAQMEQALIGEARRELIAGAGNGEDMGLADAFADVLSIAGEHGLDRLLANFVAEREGLREFLNALGGSGDQHDQLKGEFGFTPADTAEQTAASAWPDPYFDAELARSFRMRAVEAGKSTAEKFGDQLVLACGKNDPLERLDALRDVFLRKKDGEWDVRSTRQIASKGVGEYFPEFVPEFERCAGELLKALNKVALLLTLEATDAALTIADRLIGRYERLKSARGYLDFNDLISRTANLLARQDAGPWVQYKLDKGLDHILIDEAQDTSPGQWSVIQRLAFEFFEGLSSRTDVQRTVFAVGDEKQSIYSFQGAEPAAFAESGQDFATKIAAAGSRFVPERLNFSFRSVADILSAVDLVFASENAKRGLTVLPEPVSHSPVRANDPGFVDIWPLIGPDAVDEPEDWTVAIDHASQPAVKLAEAVAGRIKDWIDTGERIEGKGRKLSAGDIMVLVRKRDSFVHALSRSLKNLGVAVAGADRLKLRDHIAIRDMIAIGRFAIQPNDDLSLAALLRSPVFEYSDDELFELAHGRGEDTSLWQRLCSAGRGHSKAAKAAELLGRWSDEAGFRSPVDFFGAILGRDGVRASMIGRLGHEAGEILDEFINFAFASEQAGATGLASFLETLDHASPEIKREIAQTRDEVRIMTVHAAKGLEAPVVFLVDNGAAAFVHQHLPQMIPFKPQTLGPCRRGYLWRAGQQSDVSSEIAAGLKKKAEDEYRRLLYVGMTRAEDRLMVCGYHGVRGLARDTWYSLITDALKPECQIADYDVPGVEGDILRYRANDLPPIKADHAIAGETIEETVVPQELRQNLPPEEPLPRPFAPSGAAALVESENQPTDRTSSPVLGEAAQPGFAIERGIITHRLLQELPEIDDANRIEVAKRYIERHGAGWSEQQRSSTLNSVMRILDDPQFQSIFLPGSRSEVALAGHLTVNGRLRAVSGKIDRIVVGDKAVQIIDYKTNRSPPRNVRQIPADYIAQIAIYAELLGQIYPERKISAGLLFTETPEMFEIPETVMAEALERLAVS